MLTVVVGAVAVGLVCAFLPIIISVLIDYSGRSSRECPWTNPPIYLYISDAATRFLASSEFAFAFMAILMNMIRCSGLSLAASWAGVAVFDCMIFLLTLYKVFSRRRQNGPELLTVLLRDGKEIFAAPDLPNGLPGSIYFG
jgi:hypothetical protein